MPAPTWLTRLRLPLSGRRPFGVYTLANDVAVDWLVALLESLRCRAPQLDVAVIAFDHRMAKIRALARKYRFRIVENKSLTALDAIGRQISDGDEYQSHFFRKLAVFWGPFATFLYLDSDIVVTGSLDRLIEVSTASPADFLYHDASLGYVYKPGPLRERMLSSYDAKSFNAGCFFSRRGVLTQDDVAELAREAFPLRAGFMPMGDQPFFNYCVDVRRLKVQALWEVLPELAPSTWANLAYEERDGALRLIEPGLSSADRRVLWLHWAGFQLNEAMPNRDLWLRYGGTAGPD